MLYKECKPVLVAFCGLCLLGIVFHDFFIDGLEEFSVGWHCDGEYVRAV